ncbi:MAG: sulfatase-like hydrolase/transferase, partial [Verrucomicrobiae bacterium]|nr:sulfatase-like hydrolase/transferase [Verrucomicrobiae bacterium]
IPGGPTAVGFDSYFGADVPNRPPFCFMENDRTVGIPSEFAAPALFGKNMASKQGPAVEGWRLEPILPTLTDRVIDFIQRHAKQPQPFLLCFSLTSPHTPLAVNDEWKDKSGLNRYADFVMETDAAVGRVLEALGQSGARGNTLVILTSDNGCAPYIGADELERKGHFPSGPLRGYKSDAWEGGHRVPFIVRWPGVVQRGTVSHQLVHQADLMATVAETMGAKLPETAGEDSFSLMPLFKGGDKPVRDHAVSASIRGVPALRSGSWKYIPAPGSGGWSEGADPGHPVQLYNLAEDPGETTNLDVSEVERVAQMRNLLEELIVRGRSTPGPGQKNDVDVRRYPESSDGSGRQ